MEHVNAEILRAIADGKKVQYRSTLSGKDWIQYGPWEDFDGKDIEACWSLLASGPCVKWRIAPKTIKVGNVEVPEPCREVPEPGWKVWAIHPVNRVEPFTWYSSKACYDALKGGFVHLTEKAAEQHYEAIKSLLAK